MQHSKKNYIKMNDSESHLSLGMFFEVLKKETNNKNSTIQTELFCIIFDVLEINDTTVNNYCTGYRAINKDYKEKYLKLKRTYSKDPSIFKNIILNLIYVLEGIVYNIETSDFNYIKSLINNNTKLKNVCIKLYNISKNDSEVSVEFSSKLNSYLSDNNLYEFVVQILFFIVLEKKQPVYLEDEFSNTIENLLYNTNISVNDIKEILTVQLNEGIWSIRAIYELAKRENPYACFEIGALEFYGQIAGYPRYVESYKYYKIAADKGHPVARWAIGFMHYNGFIGSKSDEDYKIAWDYFIKSNEQGCVAAINSIGLAYLEGHVPEIYQKDENTAIKYFKEAASKKFVYAFNNLGKICERNGNHKDAFGYFLNSANLEESWAANKVGEYYRLGLGVSKDWKKSFEYYSRSAEASIHGICLWSKFNLAKYFYKNGNVDALVEKDINKAIELFKQILNNNIITIDENLKIEAEKELNLLQI